MISTEKYHGYLRVPTYVLVAEEGSEMAPSRGPIAKLQWRIPASSVTLVARFSFVGRKSMCVRERVRGPFKFDAAEKG